MRLSDMRPGETGVVVSMDAARPTHQRLMEMGLIPGTRVALVRRAPMGDPLQISLRGYELVLRRDDAKRILLDEGAR